MDFGTLAVLLGFLLAGLNIFVEDRRILIAAVLLIALGVLVGAAPFIEGT